MKVVHCPHCGRYIKLSQCSINDFGYSSFHETMVGQIVCPFTDCEKNMSVHLMFVAYKEIHSVGQ